MTEKVSLPSKLPIRPLVLALSHLLKETVALRAHCSPLNPMPMLGFGKLSTWRQADTSPFPALGFSMWVGGKSALEQVVGGCAEAFYCSHLS